MGICGAIGGCAGTGGGAGAFYFYLGCASGGASWGVAAAQTYIF